MKITIIKKFFIFASIISLITMSFSQSALAAQSLIENLLFAVVQISTLNDEGENFIGSGTTIRSDGLVLTNYHVVIDKDTNTPFPVINICYTISQYKLPRCAANAKVIALNEGADLALIRPNKKLGPDGLPTNKSFVNEWRKENNKFYIVPFRNTNTEEESLPNILDRITIWGYPAVGGSTITVTSGFVSGFDIEEVGEDSYVKFIKTDSAVNPGNSGGAAFDESYNFIGIPSNAWPGQLGFIIPVKTIVEWLESLHKQKIINIKSINSLYIKNPLTQPQSSR